MARPHPRRRRQSPKPLSLPQVELTIDRLSHDGRGMARWQDKPVFVAGALAGETVRAQLTKAGARFAEAVTEDVLIASDSRLPPECPHFGECGGCQLQYMSSEAQLVAKQAAVLDQLWRIGKVTPAEVAPAISAGAWGYRQHSRLGVWVTPAGKVTLGFRRFNARELVDINQCLVLTPGLQALLPALRQMLAEWAPRAVTHIALAEVGGQSAVVLRHTQPLAQPLVVALQLLAERSQCFIWLQGGGSPYELTDLEGTAVNPRLHYNLPAFDCRLAVHPADFMQINQPVNVKMVSQAVAWLSPGEQEHVLDLFCGVGNFTLPLARRAGRVTGVEATEAMVARGRENAQSNGVANTAFVAADLTALQPGQLLEKVGRVDAILLDPPRDGAREVCTKIAELKPQRLVYVSCNPATLARDAQLLQMAGYGLQRLGILDMFPHTSHVESMALFVKQKD